MRSKLKILLVPFLFLTLSAEECYSNDSPADREMAQQTSASMAEAQAQTGMPGIINWQERKLVRMLYELRDQESFSTFTYTVDMNGNKHLLCQSVGYGIPYAVQFSNPERRRGRYADSPNIPQPEPNGLFMPDALSATWIMCSVGGEVKPVYVEPSIIVSPVPLETGR
jgi:hypothetical protein